MRLARSTSGTPTSFVNKQYCSFLYKFAQFYVILKGYRVSVYSLFFIVEIDSFSDT